MLANNSTPYATFAQTWADAGWSPLPLPPGQKSPVPVGFTGIGGKELSPHDVHEILRRGVGAANLAIRARPDVIGIDVDCYGDKHGDKTLAALEKLHGQLPHTMRSTSRGQDNPSGIRWYRIPPEFIDPTRNILQGVLGPGIETVQHGHRYGVMAPSIHPKTHKPYQVFNDRDGSTRTGAFTVGTLAELPAQWCEGLAAGHVGRELGGAAEMDADEARTWLTDYGKDQCRSMTAVIRSQMERLGGLDGASRHEWGNRAIMALVLLAGEGHRGVHPGIALLRSAWLEAFDGDDDGKRDLAAEWRRMVLGAVAKVAGPSCKAAHGKSAKACNAANTPPIPPGGSGGTTDVWPNPNAPAECAEHYLANHRQTPEGVTSLRFWRDDLWSWTGSHWKRISENVVLAELYTLLAHAVHGADSAPWRPSRAKMANLMEAVKLAAGVLISDDVEADTTPCVPFANGYLDMATGKFRKHSPTRFTLTALPIDYDPRVRGNGSACPTWIKFIKSLNISDEEVTLLKEWFGYVVSGDSSLQKMMLLLGPARAGKGVITHTLQALVGEGAHISPTIDQFGQNFGLQALIGKSLITINDARFDGSGRSKPVVERLLNISSGDQVVADRKHKDLWTGIMPGRIMIVSNEMPRLPSETSSALFRRFIGPLELHKSFVGHEDTHLGAKLLTELAGIMAWALDGYAHLQAAGKFTEPAASQVAAREFVATNMPMTSFVSEQCVIDPDVFTPKTEVYERYRAWCVEQGNRFPSNMVHFSRDLRSVTDGAVTNFRPRVEGERVNCFYGIRLRSQ